MITQLRPRPATRSRGGRARLGFDSLETRLALSASTLGGLSIVAIDPAPGLAFRQTPPSFSVGFSQPIDVNSLFGDFRIDLVGPDGSTTSVTDDSPPSDQVSGDGTTVLVTPTATLAPGHYHLVLQGGAGMVDQAGDSPVPDGNDLVVDDFIVDRPGVGLGDAVDLGNATGQITTQTGSLNLADDLGAVAFYKIEVPSGHSNYRLGVEVDAQRLGSPLRSVVSLFDVDGRPIATDSIGRSDFPSDPYLFAGVAPGTYYIGVSGFGNVPGEPGGYDPAADTSGEANQGLSSGSFTLNLVADPADTPTHVLTSFLNYADPTIAIPTGMTIQFDGPLDVLSLNCGSDTSVSLINDAGQSFKAEVVGYNEWQASVTFLFVQALPAGHYSVTLPSSGGIADLGGNAPTAVGKPAGTIAQFSVTAQSPSADPHNFGPVAVGAIKDGVGDAPTLAPGQTVTYRIVVPSLGDYTLQTQYDGGKPTIEAIFYGTSHSFDAGDPDTLQRPFFHLSPGVITLTFTGGDTATNLAFKLRLVHEGYDQILDNGVGQSSALSLRLIAPEALTAQPIPTTPSGDHTETGSTGGGPDTGGTGSVGTNGGGTTVPTTGTGTGTATNSGPSDGPSAAVAGTTTTTTTVVATVGSGAGSTSAAPTTTASPSSSGSGGSTSGLVVASAGQVGHPSSGNDAISVVGPAGTSGLASLATSSADGSTVLGLIGRGRTAPGLNAGSLREVPESAEEVKEGETTVASTPAPPESTEAIRDDALIATAVEMAVPTPIDRMSTILASVFKTGETAPAAASSAGDDAILEALGNTGSPDGSEGDEQVETANLSGALVLGVVAAAVVHYRTRIGKWFGRGKTTIVARKGTARVFRPDPPAA